MQSTPMATKGKCFHHHHATRLMMFDAAVFLVAELMVLIARYPYRIDPTEILWQAVLGLTCILGCRAIGHIYQYVWRYGRTALYIRLIITDAAAGAVYCLLERLLPAGRIGFIHVLAIVALNLLAALLIRFVYQYLYDYSSLSSKTAGLLRRASRVLTGIPIEPQQNGDEQSRRRKINIAIVGAGRVGVMLAEELTGNPRAAYHPCCFIDKDREKIGRMINGIEVLAEAEATQERLSTYPIQEIVFALPEMSVEHRRALYERYKVCCFMLLTAYC